jgi:hypothetical protein
MSIPGLQSSDLNRALLPDNKPTAVGNLNLPATKGPAGHPIDAGRQAKLSGIERR